jgi:FAD/FMN-containing dehydrogenase
MSPERGVASEAIDELRSDVTGQVFAPGEAGYDEARRAWNLTADQRPPIVVEAGSAADVATAVRFARSHALRIAPQGTGHGAAPLEPLGSALLLRTSRLRGVRIDPAGRIARVEAGALWHDVAVPASDHGLAGLAGSSLGVGVTGYTLGGGIGWLARRYGLAANSVTAAEIVLPDGRLVRADHGHEADLFWAVRGGGGSVGVVTALELLLYPVPELYAGVLFFPVRRAAEVLHAWREWNTSLPDEVTSIGRILRVPPLPTVPDQLRGRAFAMVEAAYCGDEATGTELTAPLRKLGPEIDTFATIPAPALSQLHMDPTEPVPAVGDGFLLTDFPAAAIDTLVGLAGADADTSLISIEVRHLEGALRRSAADGGALPYIDASYAAFGTGNAATPDAVATVRGQAQALQTALAPWHASYGYYNWADHPSPAQALLPADAYRRLQQIKTSRDPDDVIISAHPV